MRKLERILAYVCLVVVLTLGLVWGVFDAWVPDEADLSRVLGFILGLMAIATAYTFTRYSEVKSSLDKLRGEVSALAAQTGRLSDSLDAQLDPVDLKTAFEIIAKRCPAPDRVRIRAVTSQIIQQTLFNHDFVVGKCDVLVHQPRRGTAKALETNIQSVIRDWKDRHVRNNIAGLEIRRSPDLPTEYEIMFDDQVVLWGMYILDPADRTGVRFTRAKIIGATGAGNQELVNTFIERFDLLFADARHEYSSD